MAYPTSSDVTANTDATAAQYNALRYDAVSTRVIKYKASQESISSSATLQNDNDLSFAVGTNETWHIDMTLFINTNTTADFKWGFTGPTGSAVAIGLYTIIYNGSTGGVVRGVPNMGSSDAFNGDSANFPIYVAAVITTSSTTGTVQLVWSQNTSDASSTIVKGGSFLRATRIA